MAPPPSTATSSSVALPCLVAISTGYTLFVRNHGKAKTKITSASEVEVEAANTTAVAIKGEVDAPRSIPREIDTSQSSSPASESTLDRIQNQNTITIAYASTTGTCKNFATMLHAQLTKLTASTTCKVQICTVNELDWWDELLNEEEEEDNEEEEETKKNNVTTLNYPPIVIFILPTWTGGTLPEQYGSLLTSLDEITNDWRVAPKPLRRNLAPVPNEGDGTTTKKKIRGGTSNHKQDKRTIQIASFGMGSTAYDKTTFCKPAKDVFRLFMKLGSRSLLTSHGKSVVGMGDDDAGDCKAVFRTWMERIVDIMEEMMDLKQEQQKQFQLLQKQRQGKVSSTSSSNVSVGCCQSNDKDDNNNNDANNASCACQEEKVNENEGCCSSNTNGQELNVIDEDDDFVDDEEDDDDDDYSSAYESDFDEEEEKEPEVMDLEDIGNAMQTSAKAAGKSGKSRVVKAMVTPKQAVALKKEGYRIIGTHSAVKLCRWTKHQLRGRGGCYKHTFYGITSYQCMEATPSLACANKCVFCWRHHKNPVGREWRWKTDDPNYIVDQAVKEHISMIKETKGIPGVKKERWLEAHTVRHCALSLVGEPIMYPRIDEFLEDLHERDISTFLVTNGQHPQAIETLRPITQLYVSVDASTPETLEAIDRPLFKDAWDRLRRSLKSLKDKGQRTVARLTVVKGWNSDEIAGYAKLIALGHCSLVEVKGVTFCGKSDASNLNMSNTPWHHEVITMVKNLQQELQKIRDECPDEAMKIPQYGIACEHKHSVSVLLARVDQFSVDDPVTGKRRWKTWIDYDKFQQLAAKNAKDPTFTFGVKDYIEDTPEWALFGAEEEGFDPTDTRHRRKKKHPKYTKFDDDGIPTHHHDGKNLNEEERKSLKELMERKKQEIGDGVSVIGLQGGEKVIDDASLMFRGLTVIK